MFSTYNLLSFIFASILLTFSQTSSFATGFYTGFEQGYSSLQARFQNDYFDTVDLDTSSKSTSNSGIVANLLLGWQYSFNDIFSTGFEIAFSLDSNTLNQTFIQNNAFFTLKAHRRYAIIPSWVICTYITKNWYSFLKLGISFSTYKSRLILLDDRLEFTYSKKYKTFSPTLGLGYRINPSFAVQGSLGYESAYKFSKTILPILAHPFLSDSYYVQRSKITFYTAKIGIIYNF